ncbi:MAG TPA: response regulator transcription factor [Candidatus Aminicenantes bacterium]|nr:response regulator transcription factor [Candidatus Aminicenantes bacterium]HRY65341.1 response regulator transcription factor [Candidatus Aminicenantes bacterium]HRZ72191.1 response regulator transcription factor [Candidatus Aminicenantes bacterium]
METTTKSPKPSKGAEASMEKKKTPDTPEPKISLLVFCPSDIILSGILRALEADPELEILNIEKNTIESFMDSIRKLKPQVILFAHMEALPNLREICKAIREMAKTQGRSELLLMGSIPAHEEIVNLINAGARGYFDLNDSSSQLPEAVRAVHKGEIWLPRDKMSSIMDRIISVVGRELKEKTLDQLTPTEFQVLRLIGQGKSNDEIAELMFISKNTVRSHIKSIYAKLDTHSRLQLALYAINSALF